MPPCLPLPQAKPPGAEAPQEGDIRPSFLGSRGRQGLVSAAASVGPERSPPGTRTPRTPGRSWGFTPNPTTFEKVDETFTCLHPAKARAACSPPSASPGALKRRSRLECPGTGRSRTPGLGIRKCTTMAQTRINTGVFIVVQVYKNKGKRTRTGHTCTPRQQWKAA